VAASTRGFVPIPVLDDRRWEDLVEEARALIPRYAPQWTDHNPSDVGITLVELFAWLVETLIYRLNRVPEKHYAAFLELLGIRRDPQTPARAWLTFTAAPAQVAGVTVPRGTRAQTQGSETEAPIVFETDHDVLVLPTTLATTLFVSKGLLANKYANVSGTLTAPPAGGRLFTVPGGQAVTLALGFDAQTAATLALRLRLFRPVASDPVTGAPTVAVDWRYSRAALEPGAWPALPSVVDETDTLRRDGTVRITPPADWAAQAPSTWAATPAASAADAVTVPHRWIGLRIANLTTATQVVGIAAILFNAASAHNALTVTGEAVATGDGTPFQAYALANGPLFRRPDSDTPYDHLVLDVAGTTWRQVSDIPAGAGQLYRADPVGAEVGFGNHDSASGEGHGTVPPAGAAITALAYRYAAGGRRGNVGAGTITALSQPVAGITGVRNLASAAGGSDEEPVEEAKRRAPLVLRNRNRAVTAEDYEYLAREATTDVTMVRSLVPRLHVTANAPAWQAGDPWTFGSLDRSPGNITVIVVPDLGPLEPRPAPSRDLVQEVSRYLDRRRDVTARLSVAGPRYLPVKVVIDAYVWQRAIDEGRVTGVSDVYLQIADRVRAFLDPVRGGPDGTGWNVGQSAFIADVFAAAMPAEEVGYIASLTLEAQIPAYHDPPLGPGGVWDPDERPFALSGAGAWVRVADYETVCFGAVELPSPPHLPV
jgi:uncharacterized phage protein gp47/JayE